MDDVTAAHYFAGVIGLALMRGWYIDGTANSARMRELAGVLDAVDQFPHSLVLNPVEHELIEGYAAWAPSYDGPNPLIANEEPALHEVLDRVVAPGMAVLDAACGTGRIAAELDRRHCAVTGIDQSEAMLAVARRKVPSAQFEQGDIRAMPFADGSFDVAVIGLALCHLDDPRVALVELGRVLRPGGRLVITDPHPMAELAGGQAFYGGIVEGRPMDWVRNHRHSASTWLAGFRAARLSVDECHEVPMSDEQIAASPASTFFPEATQAAVRGMASLWIWVVSRHA